MGFNCSNCGAGRFTEVMYNVTVMSKCSIVDGQIVYGEQSNVGNVEIDHYGCSLCGVYLYGPDGELIVDNEDIVAAIEEGTYVCKRPEVESI